MMCSFLSLVSGLLTFKKACNGASVLFGHSLVFHDVT